MVSQSPGLSILVMNNHSEIQQIHVWDLGVRIFHWFLVSLVVFQWLSSEVLDDWMDWHLLGGYCVLGLIFFRVIWGFFGPTYSRFSNMLYRPSDILSYLRTVTDKNATAFAGHNPLGGLAVVLMLALLLAQSISGLFMTDDIFLEGPYHATESEDLQDLMSYLHNQVFNLILSLIVLHIATVLYYQLYKKQLIVNAMLHGNKFITGYTSISSNYLLRLAVIVFISGLITYLIVAVIPPESVDMYDYY